jgi:GNAT superfamily N-acetyltransferase
LTTPPGRIWSQALSAADLAHVSEAVVAHGRAQLVDAMGQEIACGLYEGRRLIAGALGRTECQRLFVHHHWVDPAERNKGLGSDLLRRLEAQALARGCVDALIETVSDRSAALYERLGYVCMAHLHDYLPGFTRHTLIKVWKPRD